MKKKLLLTVLLLLLIVQMVVPASAQTLEGSSDSVSCTAEKKPETLNAESTIDFTIYGTYDYKETQDALPLINQTRKAAGEGTLVLDPVLTDLAMLRAAEIAIYWSTDRPDGSDGVSIYEDNGYDGLLTTKSWIIGRGFENAQEFIGGLSSSSLDTLNTSALDSVGIGCFYQDNGTKYWCLLFYGTVENSSSTSSAAVNKSAIPITIRTDNLDLNYVGFDGEYMYLNTGETAELVCYVENMMLTNSQPIYLSGGYSLSSTNTAVATASGTTVTGVSAGYANIRVYFGNTFFTLPYKIEECNLSAPVVKATNVASSGKIKLTWGAVSGAEEYKVYRATSKSGTYKLLKTLTGTSFTNTSAKVGKTYYYYVVAVDADGNQSEASEIVSRTCDCARPEIKLSNVASSGKIKIKWDAVEGAEEYKVYRATSKDGEYSLLKTVTGTSLTNTSAKAGKTYYYKVKAIGPKEAANSAYSAVKSRTCDLARPDVSITLNSKGKPKLTWDEVSGAKEYDVYRATSKNGEYSLLKTVTGTSLTNTSAKAGKVYYYKVVAAASKSAADSAYSKVDFISATSVSISDSKTVKDFVTEINKYRTKQGLPELKWYSDGVMAARIRAAELKEKFSSTRPDGSKSKDMLKAYGLENECFARDYTSASTLAKDMLKDSTCAKICLSEDYTYAVAARNGNYWVVIFG